MRPLKYIYRFFFRRKLSGVRIQKDLCWFSIFFLNGFPLEHSRAFDANVSPRVFLPHDFSEHFSAFFPGILPFFCFVLFIMIINRTLKLSYFVKSPTFNVLNPYRFLLEAVYGFRGFFILEAPSSKMSPFMDVFSTQPFLLHSILVNGWFLFDDPRLQFATAEILLPSFPNLIIVPSSSRHYFGASSSGIYLGAMSVFTILLGSIFCIVLLRF